MNEEDRAFIDVTAALNTYPLVMGRTAYLRYGYIPDGLQAVPYFDAYAERQFDKSLASGDKLFYTILGDNERFNKLLLLFIDRFYEQDRYPENNTLTIDYQLLNSPFVLLFLRDWYNKGYITKLNILGSDFSLDEATYNNISYMNTIYVPASNVRQPNITVKDKTNNFNIGLNSDHQQEADFVITENLTDDEISKIIENINANFANRGIINKICIRFYNPTRSAELIQRFERLGLDSSVQFDILGYPLAEYADAFNGLEEISQRRKIGVSYVCCHDLLELYCREPFAVENSYISELEPGGKTDLGLYLKILRFVKNFEDSVGGVSSTLEKTMMAYQYLNNNYYYDVNTGEDKPYGATRDLDKIMDTDEIVCVGYANLLTLMCRRVNIPMFTYGAPRHKMNVARIIEKDNDDNVVLDKICTFDSTNDCGYYKKDGNNKVKVEQKDSYAFFGLDPAIWLYDKKPSFYTLANSLAVAPSIFHEHMVDSKAPIEYAFSSYYTADAYRYSMFHLMGYRVGLDTVDSTLSQLQEEDRIGGIPEDMILNAARNIERRKHPEMDDNEFSRHFSAIRSRILDSFNIQNSIFNSPTSRISVNFGPNNDSIEYVQDYHSYIDSHEHIDLAAIDEGPVKYEDLTNLPNGNNDIGEVQQVDTPHEETPVVGDTPLDTPNDTLDPITDASEPTLDTDVEPVIDVETPEEPQIENTESEPDVVYTGMDPVNTTFDTDNMFTEDDFGDEYIAGTNIRKPRVRGIYETDEEYTIFLTRYYDYYFPNASNNSLHTYRLKKDQIIQDLPIYSIAEQNFDTPGMTDEEIEFSRSRIS